MTALPKTAAEMIPWLTREVAELDNDRRRMISIAGWLARLAADEQAALSDYQDLVFGVIEALTVALSVSEGVMTHAAYVNALQKIHRANVAVRIADDLQADVALRVALIALARTER